MIRIRRYEIFLTVVWLIAINLHRFFDMSGIKADIYLFYDYPGDGRMMSNILYEIGMHLSRLIPAFILALRINHIFFFSLFAYLFLDFAAYILFFGQNTNIYVIIISLVLIIFYQWKKHKKINGL